MKVTFFAMALTMVTLTVYWFNLRTVSQLIVIFTGPWWIYDGNMEQREGIVYVQKWYLSGVYMP